MNQKKEQYEEGQFGGINDNILDKNYKYKEQNNKMIYILFFLIIAIIIIGVFFLFITLRKNDETNTKKNDEIIYDIKKNAEIVTSFFKDGYENKDFDKVMTYMVENYYDHSPASARSNADAVAILKNVQNIFSDVKVEMLDLICEKDMVSARIWFKVTHTGEYNGIPPSGKTITYEALENFKVVNGKITESWGYWPDKQIEEKLRANETNETN